MKPVVRATALLLACAGLLAGCGQTGALYLPDQAVKTPVEVHPAPPPSGDAAAPARPQDEATDKQKQKAPQ